MSPTGRGTDPLDHLRLQCSEGNVVATSVAKAAIEFVQARISALDRKAKAFDLIAAEAVHGIREKSGEWKVYRSVADFKADRPDAVNADLLGAIESAVEVKESKHG